MAWTDASTNTSTWSEEKGTVWDGGSTEWDTGDGSIALTYWDVTADSWVDQTGNSATWTAA